MPSPSSLLSTLACFAVLFPSLANAQLRTAEDYVAVEVGPGYCGSENPRTTGHYIRVGLLPIENSQDLANDCIPGCLEQQGFGVDQRTLVGVEISRYTSTTSTCTCVFDFWQHFAGPVGRSGGELVPEICYAVVSADAVNAIDYTGYYPVEVGPGSCVNTRDGTTAYIRQGFWSILDSQDVPNDCVAECLDQAGFGVDQKTLRGVEVTGPSTCTCVFDFWRMDDYGPVVGSEGTEGVCYRVENGPARFMGDGACLDRNAQPFTTILPAGAPFPPLFAEVDLRARAWTCMFRCEVLWRTTSPGGPLVGIQIQGGTLCECIFDTADPQQGLPVATDSSPTTQCFQAILANGLFANALALFASGMGDPHFKTWHEEHFEFHGQCDVVMLSVKNFGGPGIDLDIHVRTKIVRYWSYIQRAAIRIGNDILEVEGGDPSKNDDMSYWINFEHLGELTTLGSFPVCINDNKDRYVIDLGSAYPGQSIEIKTFKEFVGVKILGATQESFGNSVGILGDFRTGKTFARDGTTVLDNFNDLGMEWQVLPSDGKLFHEMARPQFPELCWLPEDPRGDRNRRMLEESDISMEQAQEACASLKDALDQKDCIYDVLATQDMGMVGAF